MDSHLESMFVTHSFRVGRMLLDLASQVQSSAVGVEVSFKHCATLPDDSLQVQLLCRSLSRLLVTFIMNTDDPSYLLPSHSDISYNIIMFRNCS